jgi:hypothetical protein
MRHYGPMYKRQMRWRRFSEKQDIPLASILLHTGRLLIQLPKIEEGNDLSAKFFTEFLGVSEVNRRYAATHGIILERDPINTGIGIWKHLKEDKPGLDSVVYQIGESYFVDNGLKGHYGINLAIGGFGNKHFLSQNVIDNKGGSGHLYLYYLPATQESPGGLLIGNEQSAPMDCAPEIRDNLLRVHDNCRGVHTVLGGSNKYTATGGTPWAREDKLNSHHLEYEGLKEHGPDEYYDAMFMHMSSEQLQHIFENYHEDNFDPSWLFDSPNGHYKLDTLGHDRLNTLYEQKNNALDSELSPKALVRLPYSLERDVLKTGNTV